jgi:hypothetical protein
MAAVTEVLLGAPPPPIEPSAPCVQPHPPSPGSGRIHTYGHTTHEYMCEGTLCSVARVRLYALQPTGRAS